MRRGPRRWRRSLPPTGEVRPAYSWSAVPGATAYFVWVDGPEGNRISTWYPASVCTGDVCSVRPAAPLAGGEHRIEIQARTRTAFGEWSGSESFSVEPGAPAPEAPTVLAPLGASVIEAATPTYTWSRVAHATSYRLWLEGPAGVALDASYEADDVCVDDTCSTVPDTVLMSGPHALWVRAVGDAGTSPWSDAGLFSVENGIARPGPVSSVAPSGTVGDSSPTYAWSPVLTANAYHLVVEGESGVVLDEVYAVSEACEADACAVTPPVTLSDGDYSWSVQATNEAGAGPFSSTFKFTVER